MKKLLFVIIFTLFFSTKAFSAVDVELDLGWSSPNKGLLGARISPMPHSFGIIWGSFSNFIDIGFSYSYHFLERTGPYAFQSHHWLNSDVGNIWEINTGGGFQFTFMKSFLGYIELGIPIYIGDYRIFRYYKGGVPQNDYKNGDVIFLSFRTGIGVAYWFEL